MDCRSLKTPGRVSFPWEGKRMGTLEIGLVCAVFIPVVGGIFFGGYAWGKSVGLKQGLQEAAKLRSGEQK